MCVAENATATAAATGGTLYVKTGSNAISNAGLLEASNGGTLDVRSAVDNTGGTLETNRGNLIVRGTITNGNATIAGGRSARSRWWGII